MGIDYTDLWVFTMVTYGFLYMGSWVWGTVYMGSWCRGSWPMGYWSWVLGFGYQGFQGPAPQGPGYWVPYEYFGGPILGEDFLSLA